MNLLPRRRRNARPSPAVLAGMLRHWFATPQGAAVLEAEGRLLAPILERLFGYHLLQLGCGGDSLMDASPVGHKILFAPVHRPAEPLPVADIEELPLPSESMDGVLIHHGLDFTADCHRLLREATRVLRPGGRMLIIGFNPMGLWGLWRLFKSRRQLPWCGRFIPRQRVADWCRLLDLQPQQSRSGVHFPPFGAGGVGGGPRESLSAQESPLDGVLAGVYLLDCEKQVTPVTPITPRWAPLRPAAIAPAAEARVPAPPTGSTAGCRPCFTGSPSRGERLVRAGN